MDKPTTLSVKNFLIRRMAVELMIPEKIIEAIVNHQFASILEAMQTCNSVEMSGFGKFIFADVRAKRTIGRYRMFKEQFLDRINDETQTEIKKKNAVLKVEILEKKIIDLDRYIHAKPERTNRRVEK